MEWVLLVVGIWGLAQIISWNAVIVWGAVLVTTLLFYGLLSVIGIGGLLGAVLAMVGTWMFWSVMDDLYA